MTLKKGAEVELEIDSTAYKGKGVAKVNGLAVFVPNTTPGDKVRARIVKRKKNYREAKLLEILESGPHRIEPRCRHALTCGGCNWQHVDYDFQLEFKREQVRDHLERIGGLENLEIRKTVPCEQEFYYRNKMEYSIGHRRWLSREEIEKDEFVSDRGFAAGLHAPGRFDKILNIQECHLQDSVSYEILDFIRSYCRKHDIAPYDNIDHEGFMRNVVIRNSYHTDDLMVNLVTYRDAKETVNRISEALLDSFPAITTIVNNVNDTRSPTAVGRFEHVIHGPGFITDYIGNYRFKIDANSFFQTNTAQAEKLFDIARTYADPGPDETVYDLYCGVGSLSLYFSEKAGKVVGIELVKVAVENARENARDNNVENVEFVKGDLKKVFTPGFSDRHGQPGCIVTDPPRAGMHPDVVDRILELEAPKIVYVSCNSSTMARDLKKMNEKYEILEVQPVDMFPQTYHIETVANLRLK